LRSNWRQVIEQAPERIKRTPAVAILRSAGVKPVAFEGDTVILTFRYPYHKEKIEELENRRITAEIISNFVGHACQVRCVYEPEENYLVREAQRIGAKIIDVEEK
jgi:DNA polymerase-3 subunit gamma/tau